MASNLREIINFSLVIVNLELLASEGSFQGFQSAVDADIRHGGGVSIDAATGQTQQARILHLDRDRVNLNLSPARSSVTKEFPAVDGLAAEAARFAQIVNSALLAGNDLGGALYDFGYNAEMVFDQDSNPTAFEFLGERLLRKERVAPPNRQFLGGACRMIIRDELGQWTYNLEPRFNDPQTPRVFVNVNLHNEQRPLPQGTAVADAVVQLVGGVRDLMGRLAA
ncbi:MAG: hypothetical protein OXL37_06930 [Chloroflexota bacterium]|nr:hypothetical protein [Chloroflexota bacterium]MDE2960630.1 hypothetical protein [Chloroflexota bacterium]